MDVPIAKHILENCRNGALVLTEQHVNTELMSSSQDITTASASTCQKDDEVETTKEAQNSTNISNSYFEHLQYETKDCVNSETLPGSDLICILQNVASTTKSQARDLQTPNFKEVAQGNLPCPDITSDLQDVPSDIIQIHLKGQNNKESIHLEHQQCPDLKSDLQDVPTITFQSHSKDIQDQTFQEGPNLPIFFKCGLCQSDFSSNQKLSDHLQDEHFDESFPLENCNNQIKHVLMFTGTVSFKCDLCDIHFPNFDLAENHLDCHRTQTETCGQIRKDMEHPKGIAQEVSLSSIDCLRTEERPSDGLEPSNLEGNVADQSQEELEEEGEEDFSDLISFDNHTAFEGDPDKLRNSIINDLEATGFKNDDSQFHLRGTEGLAQAKVFQCELCDESFMSQEDLENHDICHEGEPLKCKTCERTFRYSQHLKQHMKIHLKDFTCEDCSEVFEALDLLHEHKLTHSTSEVYKCAICNKQFSMKRALERHKSLHTGEKPHKCQFCGKCFRLPCSLQHHERIHKGLTPFKCDICHKRFRLSQTLKKHIFAYHSKDKPYKCDICEKGFLEKGRLTAHRSRIHFGKPIEKASDEYVCVLCQKQFNCKDSRDEHLTNFHSKKSDGELTIGEKVSDELDKVFICVKCGKGFNTCEKLLAHMRRHGEPSWMDKSASCRSICPICQKSVNYLQKHLITHTGLKPFQCEVCDKAFPERYILTKHMKSHSTIRQFECKLCSSSFKRGDNLKRHLRITHSVDPEKYDTKQVSVTKDKEFLCKKCEIVFMDEDEFKQHKKSHSEKVPAVCSMCGKVFTNNIHLKSHMKIHANWRPYMCETCGKTFTENSQLKKHTRIHTGEKPYACQLCDKSFSQSCSLNSHMKSHQFAGQTPFKCHLCPAEFAYCGELEKHKKGHLGTDVFGCGLCSLRFSHPDHLRVHVDEHLGKSSQIIESDLVGPVIETTLSDMNPFQSDPCLSYPVATVSFSNPVDPVATLSFSSPVDPLVQYTQVDIGSETNCVTVAPYPSDPNLNQSVSSDIVPQGINMFQMQTLVQEAEMLIQCTQHNQ